MTVDSGRDATVTSLGCCPNCEEEISPAYELISYETADGRRRRFAECPRCESVVHPT